MKITKYEDLLLMILEVWEEESQRVLRLRHPHFKGTDWYFVPPGSFDASEFLKDEPYFWGAVQKGEITWETLEKNSKELQSRSPYLAFRVMRRCTPSFPWVSDISYLLQVYYYPSVAEGIVKLLDEPLRKERSFGISPIDIPDPNLWRDHISTGTEDDPHDTVSLAGWITLEELKREISQVRENRPDTIYDLPEATDDGNL